MSEKTSRLIRQYADETGQKARKVSQNWETLSHKERGQRRRVMEQTLAQSKSAEKLTEEPKTNQKTKK